MRKNLYKLFSAKSFRGVRLDLAQLDCFSLPYWLSIHYYVKTKYLTLKTELRGNTVMSRIALIGENSIEYIEWLINIWNNGNCAVLIDYRIPINTAIDMMHECNTQKCYIDEKIYMGLIDEQHRSIDFIPYKCENNKTSILPFSVYDKFQSNYSKNEAVIIYSSGTTGRSKGVILSHYAINKNADDIISYMNLDASDMMYIVKTMSHASTLTGELLVCLKTKAKLLIAPIVVPPRVTLSNIKKHQVTIICVNPYLLSIISEELLKGNYDISSIKAIYVSGSILNQNLYIKAHEALENTPIYNVYGMSETGPRLAAQGIDCCKSNSVGKPIGTVQIQVIDEKGTISPTQRVHYKRIYSIHRCQGHLYRLDSHNDKRHL